MNGGRLGVTALRRLRASNQVEEDIEEMRAEERAQSAEATISMRELICSPTLRAPLIIGVVMQLSQQLSGINAVFYYSTGLFISSGLTEESAKFATIGIGAIMVGMTIVSIPLMDRTGRRTLHLYGLGGMFIFSIFITISFLIKEMIDWMSYLSVVSTLGFVVFFAVGPGSIPWMITAELFSQGPRPAAMSIAVLINWIANFVVGIGFPTMKTALENYTFLPFSAFLAIFWTFTYKKVPETKNKTFEEILAMFRHGNDRVANTACLQVFLRLYLPLLWNYEHVTMKKTDGVLMNVKRVDIQQERTGWSEENTSASKETFVSGTEETPLKLTNTFKNSRSSDQKL
uniref:Major facilitator superfamily (MFS) profile domain-containing protein n=2 Tax=Timema TaxID=61471 RepID=A0A7R9CVP4_TIMPO|nr:unnamed protein product [Timema poppensis]